MSKQNNRREYLTLAQAQELTGLNRTVEVVSGESIRIRNHTGRERRYQWTPERVARIERMGLRMYYGTHDYQVWMA